MNKKRAPQNYCFIFVLLIALLFSSNETVLTNGGVSIPFININPLPIEFAIIGFYLLFVIFHTTSNVFKLDLIQLLLILRFILLIIPVIYNKFAWGNIFAYIVSLAAYSIFSNMRTVYSDIYPHIKIVLAILIIQAFVIFATSPVEFNSLQYKYYFVAPIGGSNYFSCILMPFLLMVLYTEKGMRRIIWGFCGILAIFLSKSRTPIVVMTFFAVVIMYKYLVNRKKTRIKSLIYWIIGIISFIMLLLTSDISDYISAFMSGYSNTFVGTSLIDTITSGRISLLFDYLRKSSEHLLFGNGLNFSTGVVAPHNIIIEAIYVSGIPGAIILFGLMNFVYGLYKRSDTSISTPLYIGIVSLFICALAEKVLFTFIGDFILWTLIGCMKNSINTELPKAHLSLEQKDLQPTNHRGVNCCKRNI